MSKEVPGVRYAEIERESSETRVRIVVDIDGGSRRDIASGIGFFDHMLMQLAFHGCLNVGITAEGDLHVDDHHTIEDVGIAFGQALAQTLDADTSVVRYASNHTPMDESLVLCAIDISGRGQLYFDVPFVREKIGDVSTECIREFFRAVAMNAGMTVHIRKITGDNDHHLCEAVFKAFGRALHASTRRTDRRGPTSTKGTRG